MAQLPNFSLLQPLKPITPPDIVGAQQKIAQTGYMKQLTEASKAQEARAAEFAPLEKDLKEQQLLSAQQGFEQANELMPLKIAEAQGAIERDRIATDQLRSQAAYENASKVANVAGAVTFAKTPTEKNLAWQGAREEAQKRGVDISSWPVTYDDNPQQADAIAHNYLIRAASSAQMALKQMDIQGKVAAGMAGATGKAPPGYRWVDNDPSSGVLEAIPGGPGAKLTPQNAASKANLEAALPGWENAKKILIKPNGEIDRTAVWTGTGAVGTSLPFSKGREAYQAATRVLFAKLRLESGAAVPDSEIERYVEIYMPGKLDSDTAIKNKLANIDGFLKGADSNIKGISDESYLSKLKEQKNPATSNQFSESANYQVNIKGQMKTISGAALRNMMQRTLPEGETLTPEKIQELMSQRKIIKK